MNIDILIVGGGTGGHLFPAIATLEEVNKRGFKGSLLTDDRCMKYLKNHQDLNYFVMKSPRGEGIWGKMKYPILLILALVQSFFLILKLKPILIIVFGGYVSYPALFIGSLMGIKIMLHEQNCFLGRVNKSFASKADRLFLAFEDTLNIPINYPKDKIVIVGNPVRSEITNLEPIKRKEINTFNILVTGGSQGARFLSESIPEALNLVIKQFPKIKFSITQQARPEDIEEIKLAYNSYGISAYISDFFYNMPELLNKADLLIGRAGASTIAELIATSTPSILIPYPYAAQQHQHYNAEMIEKNGGGFMIDQNDASPLAISSNIITYIKDSKKLEASRMALKKLQKDSTHIILDTALKIMQN
jgi:UDP-N-acetylglucosamine--N-acetylmuramyl-(pentapeptide) pyrophosphoryl-undecaprenol N-acetylglucosamine transferase